MLCLSSDERTDTPYLIILKKIILRLCSAVEGNRNPTMALLIVQLAFMASLWCATLSQAFIPSFLSRGVSAPDESMTHRTHLPSLHQQQGSNSDSTPQQEFYNPIQDVFDMIRNFDDVVDDFFNKRMGNGEIYNGKRKYKPSGLASGKYNGFGLTDKRRIEVTQRQKEEWLEDRRRREEDKN